MVLHDQVNKETTVLWRYKQTLHCGALEDIPGYREMMWMTPNDFLDILKEIKNAPECIVELYRHAVIFKNTREGHREGRGALLECS